MSYKEKHYVEPIQDNNSIITNSYSVIKETSVFIKPNVESRIIGKFTMGEKVVVLNQTKYFMEINYWNNQEYIKGYILKENLKK